MRSGEGDADTSTYQFIDQIANRLRDGIVDVRYGARIDDKPTDWRRRAIHEGAHLISEALSIRKEQI